MRRRSLAALAVLGVLGLAGCGGGKTVSPTPQTVQGTLKIVAAAPGKGVFAANGCGSCHTYKPAGSTAKVGPDLDKLAQYAKQAKKPLKDFTHESIVNPKAYVQPGFPNIMPSFKQLPADQLNQLVDFLTKPQSS
jgi:cytochrome c551/c552